MFDTLLPPPPLPPPLISPHATHDTSPPYCHQPPCSQRHFTPSTCISKLHSEVHPTGKATAWIPPVEVHDEVDQIVVQAYLPHVVEDTLIVSIHGNELTILGECLPLVMSPSPRSSTSDSLSTPGDGRAGPNSATTTPRPSFPLGPVSASSPPVDTDGLLREKFVKKLLLPKMVMLELATASFWQGKLIVLCPKHQCQEKRGAPRLCEKTPLFVAPEDPTNMRIRA